MYANRQFFASYRKSGSVQDSASKFTQSSQTLLCKCESSSTNEPI